MSIGTDVLVIGGGVAGVGAAAQLAAEAQVTLLEAEPTLGYHSTGRSAAMFIANYGGAVMRALTAASEAAFADPGDHIDGPLLSPRGELLIAAPDEIEAFDATLDGAQGMERLTPAQAAAMVPILRGDRIAAAALEPQARDIDVDLFFQGLVRLLRGRGGRIETGAPAAAIARVGGIWRVTTPAGEFEAPVLVNAAGAWADVVAERAGVMPVDLTPCRRTAAIVPAPQGHDPARWPLVASASERFYFKPDAGRLMVSPADQDPVAPQDVHPDDMTLAEGLDRYAQAVTTPVTRVLRTWAGLRSFTPDRLPAAGFAPDAEGFFWLAGQGGHGVQTAPALSALTAALCAGRPPALASDIVTALSPERFRRDAAAATAI